MVDKTKLKQDLKEKGFCDLMEYVNSSKILNFLPKTIKDFIEDTSEIYEVESHYLKKIGMDIATNRSEPNKTNRQQDDQQTTGQQDDQQTNEPERKKGSVSKKQREEGKGGHVTNEFHRKAMNKLETEYEATIAKLNTQIETIKQTVEQQTVKYTQKMMPEVDHRAAMMEKDDEITSLLKRIESYEQMEREAMIWKDAYDGNMKSIQPMLDKIDDLNDEIKFKDSRIKEIERVNYDLRILVRDLREETQPLSPNQTSGTL